MFKLYFVADLFTFTHNTTVTLIRSMNKRYDLSDYPCVSCPLHFLALRGQTCFTAHSSTSGSGSPRRKMHAA